MVFRIIHTYWQEGRVLQSELENAAVIIDSVSLPIARIDVILIVA